MWAVDGASYGENTYRSAPLGGGGEGVSTRSSKRGRRSAGTSRAFLVCLGVSILVPVLWYLFTARTAAGETGVPPATGHADRIAYTAVAGDTLPALALHFGVSLSSLRALNHLSTPAALPPGTRLTIPWSAAQHPLDGSLSSGTRDLILTAAQRLGVDPNLALAIAWQESRGRQDALSDKHAVGIMQMEPDTAAQVSTLLHCPIDLFNAYDNVTAGVYWLGYLVRRYGGDEQQAIAAYYEGQANLTRYGYLPDTRLYVTSVLSFRTAFASH